jgi:prolyl-tRNA editing enzyme YbaK/EbsC (Cys-tRNA(Pro) deacylase)
MKPAAAPSALKVQAALGERFAVLEFDASTRTAEDAAAAPPVGHRTAPVALIDEALMAFGEIWAAAGTPNAVFRLTPADLVTLTGGTVGAIARR